MSGSNGRVLVAGTTADYVDALRRRFPGRLLFATAAQERASSSFATPDPIEEVLCDLSDARAAQRAIERHLEAHAVRLSGITCFDCESLVLAAELAHAFALPFPAADAVRASRNKWTAKQCWERAGVPHPSGAPIERPDDALRAFERIARPCIVKPLTGSGSELIYSVTTAAECMAATAAVFEHLAGHRDERMYAPLATDAGSVDPRCCVLIEERVDGPEFSCDFIVDGGRIDVLRLAEKCPDRRGPAGQTLAYTVPGTLPAELSLDALSRILVRAASALGLTHAACMADFIVSNGQPVLLELSPRPGGDCLPALVMRAGNVDILGRAIGFAERLDSKQTEPRAWRRLAGLRLFAYESGTIVRCDDAPLRADARVLETALLDLRGRHVEATNRNAGSAYLGYVIFEPHAAEEIEAQCRALRAKLDLSVVPEVRV